jgi:hypothetical protein
VRGGESERVGGSRRVGEWVRMGELSSECEWVRVRGEWGV